MADTAAAPRSWMLWAVAVAVIGVLTGVLILSMASSRLEQTAVRAFFIGWIVVPYVLSGLVAWWRRPASRLGPLMLLLGFTMALTPLQWSTQPLVHSIGHLLDMVPAAMFLHIFLAFPTGRLTRRPERWLVGSCYAITLGLQLVKIMLGVNPDSVFAVTDQAAVGNVVEGVQLSLVAICLLAGVVLLHRRRRGAGRSPRRPATLVVDAFSFALIMLALLYIAGIFAWPYVEWLRLGHLRRPGPGSGGLLVRAPRHAARPRRRRWPAGGTREPTRPPICRPRWPGRSATRPCACTTGCRSSARGPISTATRPPSRAPTNGAPSAC